MGSHGSESGVGITLCWDGWEPSLWCRLDQGRGGRASAAVAVGAVAEAYAELEVDAPARGAADDVGEGGAEDREACRKVEIAASHGGAAEGVEAHGVAPLEEETSTEGAGADGELVILLALVEDVESAAHKGSERPMAAVDEAEAILEEDAEVGGRPVGVEVAVGGEDAVAQGGHTEAEVEGKHVVPVERSAEEGEVNAGAETVVKAAAEGAHTHEEMEFAHPSQA